MKKWKIILIVVIAVLAIGGVAWWLTHREDKEVIDLTNPEVTVETDSFSGTVIANDGINVSVVPNEGEIIRETFAIVDATVLNKTKVTVNGEEKKAEEIAVGASVIVKFDGGIYQTSPARVVASTIDAVQNVEVEE